MSKKQQEAYTETQLLELWHKWWRAKTKEDADKYFNEYRKIADALPVPEKKTLTINGTPARFEIVGIRSPILNGKALYQRILIRRIQSP